MDRAVTCCFTGHRPDKLPWGQAEGDAGCLLLKARLLETLEQLYRQGVRHFICGMALGGDFYFAEAVLHLRARLPGITLEAARPCESQASRWGAGSRRRYEELLSQCDYETLVQHRYDPGCMMRRNRYMVDHASHLVAVYNGIPKGGTAQTLAYALKQGLSVTILDPTPSSGGNML